VNKVDEIADIEVSLPQIESRIRALLQREIPGADIPVIFGSARWAKAALTFDKNEIESQMESTVDGYVDHIAAISSTVEALWATSTTAGVPETSARM
jgi:translation elongation factor EF-Tu-like GTPase